MYLSYITSVIPTCITISDVDNLLVVLPFSDPSFAPNMSPDAIMS